MITQVRPYAPTTDRDAVFHLWEATCGATWPLFPADFYAMIDPHAEQHLVAADGGKLLGCIALSRDGPAHGSIIALLVHPDHKGDGIESTLLEAASERFRRRGVAHLRFGGGHSYFWPGVPTDHPQVVELLEQHGWHIGGQISDMEGDPATAHVPAEITARIVRSGAHLRLATAQDGPAILEFEQRHFPQWLPIAVHRVGQRDCTNILLAELDGAIVGATFLTSAGAHGLLWRRMLGEDCAAYGALGVSAAVRGRYIGYALAVRAAEILQARGAKRIYLGWVFSTEWYGRLGFQVWKTYHQMGKQY